MTDMGRYPRLIVAGEQVTAEQADVILVRTHMPFVSCSDRAWQEQVEAVFGLPRYAEVRAEQLAAVAAGVKPQDDEWMTYLSRCDEVWKGLGRLPLDYLHNDRVSSYSSDGPSGWCDWDGNIGCSNYAIGKWPTVETVTGEWRLIAEAFPFLRLQCQVMAEVEYDENDQVVPLPPVVAEWHVGDGLVRQVEIGPLLRMPEDKGFSLSAEGAERGVSIERLAAAVARTRASLGPVTAV